MVKRKLTLIENMDIQEIADQIGKYLNSEQIMVICNTDKEFTMGTSGNISSFDQLLLLNKGIFAIIDRSQLMHATMPNEFKKIIDEMLKKP